MDEMIAEIETNMDAIDREIDVVLARLTRRNDGISPEDSLSLSVPQIIEWAAERFGCGDADVAELRFLEEDYDYCRVELAELQSDEEKSAG